jgi:hypothetical protein
MPWAQFRPVILYGYVHNEESWDGYAAHTTGTLTVGVYEIVPSEAAFLGVAEIASYQKTLWTGDAHTWPHDSDAGAVPSGATLSRPYMGWFGPAPVSFPLSGGSRYMLQVEIGATADDSQPDLVGASFAIAFLQIQVVWMVVEETAAPLS